MQNIISEIIQTHERLGVFLLTRPFQIDTYDQYSTPNFMDMPTMMEMLALHSEKICSHKNLLRQLQILFTIEDVLEKEYDDNVEFVDVATPLFGLVEEYNTLVPLKDFSKLEKSTWADLHECQSVVFEDILGLYVGNFETFYRIHMNDREALISDLIHPSLDRIRIICRGN